MDREQKSKCEGSSPSCNRKRSVVWGVSAATQLQLGVLGVQDKDRAHPGPQPKDAPVKRGDLPTAGVLATATINGAEMRQGCCCGCALLAADWLPGLSGVAVSPFAERAPTANANANAHSYQRSPRGLHKCKDCVATTPDVARGKNTELNWGILNRKGGFKNMFLIFRRS